MIHQMRLSVVALEAIRLWFCRALSDFKLRDLLRFESLGSDFGRTDFSRIFIFGPPDPFADFLAGFFLLIFVGKSAQKNPPGKSPRKSSKIYTTKILQHIFLQRGWGKKALWESNLKVVSWKCSYGPRNPKKFKDTPCKPIPPKFWGWHFTP